MGDLRSRIEVAKLAAELKTDEADLAFLTASTPQELRDLRAATAEALFARHEPRVRLLASVSRMLPVPVTAKVAQAALGPMLSARVAGALDPREAARLAEHVDRDFLAELAVFLDPKRVAPIVRALPDELVVDVGQRLRRAGEFLTLARFVSLVDPRVAAQVVAGATGEQLLQVALYTDDAPALDAIARTLSDTTLADVIGAAGRTGSYDAAVALLDALSPEVCARLVSQVGAVEAGSRESLVQAVADNDVWDAVLPALHTVEHEVLAALVNVEATRDVAVIDAVARHARALDQAPVLVHLVLAMDDDHLPVLARSATLRDPDFRDWLTAHAGVSRRLIEPVLDSLGIPGR